MVAKMKNRRQPVKKEPFLSFLSKKLLMVSIRKFRIIVLVSNRIEYWSNYSIQNFKYSHITKRFSDCRLLCSLCCGPF